jgi:DNA-directed RNA polymerase beta subunit
MAAIQALNFAFKHNSPSRGNMFAGHFAQRIVIDGAEEKLFQTGVEREFGKHTFSIKMPVNATIIKILHRYPAGVDRNSLNFNPETIVIYEDYETKEIDYLSIPYYASFHQFFGFKYDIKHSATSLLRPEAYVPKDTIFADSPAVKDNSGYAYGVNLNVAFMSIPSVSEDGIMISKQALEKLKFKIYETRVVEFGSSQFPLNLYGTKDNYKPFPEINDLIREDGMLMMLRSYDNDLMPVEMSYKDVMEPDFIFDKGVYSRAGKGRIVDIKVVSNNSQKKMLPPSMCEHIQKYENALVKFHQEVVETEQKLRYERKRKYGETKLKISPKFHNLVVESLAVAGQKNKDIKQGLNLLYRKAPIDEYRIEFVIEYEMTPGIGFKLTDVHGGKGVIVKVVDQSDMPVDADGNIADIVTDSAATLSRMNIGRLYEHYYNGVSRDVRYQVLNILSLPKHPGKVTFNAISRIDKDKFETAFAHLLCYYDIVSEEQYTSILALSEEDRIQHITDVVNGTIYTYYNINTQKDDVEIVKKLSTMFKTTYGPVTYRGNSGNMVTTVDNVRIAPLYIMLLDKIADDWSSVSSGKLQHFGVLSPTTKSEKFAYPFRNSPVRTIGETEARIYAGYCGRHAIAEMMDRSNNPATQRNVIWNLLTADKPSALPHVVDRQYIPLGGARPLQLVKHIAAAAGFKIVYTPENK